MTACFNLLRCSCLASAFVICLCVCVCGAGEVGVHVHMLLQERQFISLIKSSILNVNLRAIQGDVSNVQLEVNVEFKGKL